MHTNSRQLSFFAAAKLGGLLVVIWNQECWWLHFTFLLHCLISFTLRLNLCNFWLAIHYTFEHRYCGCAQLTLMFLRLSSQNSGDSISLYHLPQSASSKFQLSICVDDHVFSNAEPFCTQAWCGDASVVRNQRVMSKDWLAIFKVKVIEFIRAWLLVLYFLNCGSFFNENEFDDKTTESCKKMLGSWSRSQRRSKDIEGSKECYLLG